MAEPQSSLWLSDNIISQNDSYRDPAGLGAPWLVGSTPTQRITGWLMGSVIHDKKHARKETGSAVSGHTSQPSLPAAAQNDLHQEPAAPELT